MNNDSTAQAGTTTEAQKVEQEQKTEKTFTQAEMNKIVQERLAKERAKYEGFDDLKEKAMKFDELQEANKSELEKAQAKVKALEEQIATAKREKWRPRVIARRLPTEWRLRKSMPLWRVPR